MKLKLIFIVVCFSISCKNNNNESIKRVSVFKSNLISDTLKIKLPYSIPHPLNSNNLYWNYNEEYFGFMGENSGDYVPVYSFNLNDNSWRTIELKFSGDNNVSNIGSFSFDENETILYFPVSSPRLIKLNFNGEIEYSKYYSEPYSHGNNNSNFNPKIYNYDNKIGFLTSQYLDLNIKKNYFKSKLFTIYDLENNTSKHIINYPDEFLGNIWSINDLNVSSIYKDDKLILNFFKSKQIYEYDLDGNLMNNFIANSSFIKDASPLKNIDNTPIENLIKSEANGYYFSLIYDNIKKVYYRIGKFYNIDNFKPKSYTDLVDNLDKISYSILVLDESFSTIEEHFIDKKDYNIDFSKYFINSNGLYVMLNNEDKEYLTFIKLEL